MFKNIVKRDGSVEKFDKQKITNVILKAGKATKEFDSRVAEKLTTEIINFLERVKVYSESVTIEIVQETVENVLMQSTYKKTAKAYIVYRDQHTKMREITNKSNVDLINGYLNRTDWRVQENSNMAFSLQGLNNHMFSDLSKTFWLNEIYTPEIKEAHEGGDFHIHDLSIIASYCCGWDLQDLLKEGFKGVPGKTESLPPKHFKSALGQLVNFFFSVQGEGAGAQAVSSLDTLLAPFIRYDNLSLTEVKQALQEFIFNMNVSTRVGFQCLSKDTEILTGDGWKTYDTIKAKDPIQTFNLRTKKFELQRNRRTFCRNYSGKMYRIKNDYIDQLVSPKHKILLKNSNIANLQLITIENIIDAIKSCDSKNNTGFLGWFPSLNSEKTSEISYSRIFISDITEVDYNNYIWCPNTENGTVVARRNGKIFLTGNSPFTNITIDLEVPSILKDLPVVIGGKEQKETYKDFQQEMNIFNKVLLEVMIEGDAKERVFTFPIITCNITNDFDWDNPILEDVWKVTAKYGILYFANYVNSDMNPEDVRSMCCRLRLDLTEITKRGGGLFGANPLTGSLGVVTLNMSRLGYLSKTKKEFFERLDKLLYLIKESLEIKRKVLERFTKVSLYPYTKFYLRSVFDRYGKYWQNHFSTIGLVGMNEACLNFFSSSIASEEGKQFSIDVLNHIRGKILKYQKETGNLYNLEATPAEGSCYSLARKDKEEFADIKTAGGSEKEDAYYTNSTQLPVNYSEDVFECLDHQDDLQTLYSSGTVFHIFAGEQINNTKVIKNLIQKVCNNYKLPYFTFSPSFSICPVHKYLQGEQPKCPSCGSECEVYSRVVGYLRPVKSWNRGKQVEFEERKTFNVNSEEL